MGSPIVEIVPNENILINPSGRVRQFRASGTVVPMPTGGTWLSDIVRVSNNLGVWTTSARVEVDSSPGDPTAIYIAPTASKATLAAGDVIDITWPIEGNDIASIFTQPYSTLSFDVKSSGTTSRVYAAGLSDSTGVHAFCKKFPVGASWSKVVVVIPAPVGGTFALDSSVGGRVFITLGAGSSATEASDGVWTSSGKRGVSGQDNIVAGHGDSVVIKNLKLEPGAIATRYEPRPFAEELARCQRYWQQSYNYGVSAGATTFTGAASSYFSDTDAKVRSVLTSVSLASGMRDLPTVALYSPATGVGGRVRDFIGGVDVAAGFVRRSASAISWTASGVSNAVTDIQSHWTADARLS